MTQMIKMSKIIAPVFYQVHKDIKEGGHTYFDLSGGRNSTKSSFASIEIVLGMMRDASLGIMSHAVCLRKVENTLLSSVYEQIGWAIWKLGVYHLWRAKKSPKEYTYIPTGQKIVFKGCDDPTKIKSIKFKFGFVKYLWFEELQEFKNRREVQSVILSILRPSGDNVDDMTNEEYEAYLKSRKYVVFRTYNPPPVINHWVNVEAKRADKNTLKHHSTYLDLPPRWVSQEFLDEARRAKERSEAEYDNVFLGIVTGVQGLVYPMFDINKHVIEFEALELASDGRRKLPLKPLEKIAKIICGADVGTVIDATTCNILLITTAERIIRLPGFYYDPQAFNHEPIGNHKQAILIEGWIDYWLEYFNILMPGLVSIYVDSSQAGQDMVLTGNELTHYSWYDCGKKDIIKDMKHLQDVLAYPDLFITIDAGYIDPISMNEVGNYDMLIEEMLALCVDENTGKPIDGNDHMIDGLKYGIKKIHM